MCSTDRHRVGCCVTRERPSPAVYQPCDVILTEYYNPLTQDPPGDPKIGNVDRKGNQEMWERVFGGVRGRGVCERVRGAIKVMCMPCHMIVHRPPYPLTQEIPGSSSALWLTQ
jgi:hypothetical protein